MLVKRARRWSVALGLSRTERHSEGCIQWVAPGLHFTNVLEIKCT